MIEALSEWGSLMWVRFWWPVTVWTVLWLVFRGVWAVRKPAHPATQYAIQWAVLAALPMGLIGASVLYGRMPAWWTPPELATHLLSLPVLPIEPIEPGTPPIVSWSLFTGFGLVTIGLGLFSLWCIGKLIADGVALRVWFRGLPKYQQSPIQMQADRLAKQWGIVRPINVFVVNAAILPITFGWRRPIILLPESVLADDTDLQMTLLHELTHIRQNDFLFHLIEQALGAIFAFHPAVHALCRAVADAREQRCDAEVLAQPQVRHHAYAHLLLRLTPADAFAPVVALTMARSPSQLKTRTLAMKALLNNPAVRPSAQKLQGYTTLWGLALSLCMILSTTAFAQNTDTFLSGVLPKVETLPSGMKLGTVMQGGFDQFIGVRGTINGSGTMVRAEVDRFYINTIQPNMAAQVRIHADATCEAVVSRVDRDAKVDREHPSGGYFVAELQTTCPAGTTVNADQMVRARILLGAEEDRIQIPRGPFYQQTSGGWVFVVDASGTSASRRMITLGRQNSRTFEVLEGLQPGEKVVVSSYEGYDTAQTIQIQ